MTRIYSIDLPSDESHMRVCATHFADRYVDYTMLNDLQESKHVKEVIEG